MRVDGREVVSDSVLGSADSYIFYLALVLLARVTTLPLLSKNVGPLNAAATTHFLMITVEITAAAPPLGYGGRSGGEALLIESSPSTSELSPPAHPQAP